MQTNNQRFVLFQLIAITLLFLTIFVLNYVVVPAPEIIDEPIPSIPPILTIPKPIPNEPGSVYPPTNGSEPGGYACTQEAKICPDGSAVGRTGPHCEFAACPSEKN